MDRIEGLRAFAAVVAAASFTKAAARLGTTTGLVSKQVKALEDELGVRLLHRTTRTVRPTETGQALYPRALCLVSEFEDLAAAVRETHAQPLGHLRVTAPTELGALCLVGIIGSFLDAYPGISLDLQLTDRHVSLIDEGFDVAIRVGELADSGLVARRLGSVTMVLCAAPAYLAKAGRPRTPAEVATHSCVIDTNLRGGDQWPFLVGGRRVTVTVRGRLRVNSASAVRQRIVAGAGLGLCPSYVVQPDLASGVLVDLLPEHSAVEYGLYALYLENRHLSARVRTFVDWLSVELNRSLGRAVDPA